ncbi:MAG: hypothetical protein COZ05_06140, partial [Armatimonadetes bacterium CG_4_10_14_3_um_filter_59_10]
HRVAACVSYRTLKRSGVLLWGNFQNDALGILISVFASIVVTTMGHAQIAQLTPAGRTVSVTVPGRAQGEADACRLTVVLEATGESLADINHALEGQKSQCLQAMKGMRVEDSAVTVDGPDLATGQGPGIFGNMGMLLQPPIIGAPPVKPAYRGTLLVKVQIPFSTADMDGSLDQVQETIETLKKSTNKPVAVAFVVQDMQSLHHQALQDGFTRATALAQKLAVFTGRPLGKVEGVVFADTKAIMGQVMGGMFGGGMMGQMLGLITGRDGSSNPYQVVVEETLTFSFQLAD